MSKIKLEAPFVHFRGKICKHSEIIFKKMYGKMFTSQICNPYTGEPSEAQVKHRQKVATAALKLNELTEQELKDYKTAFKEQTKYTTLRGYMMAQEMAKLV